MVSFLQEAKDKTFSIIITWGLVIVAALAWRDFAEEAFKQLYTANDLRGRLIYALIVTVIVIFLSYALTNILSDDRQTVTYSKADVCCGKGKVMCNK